MAYMQTSGNLIGCTLLEVVLLLNAMASPKVEFRGSTALAYFGAATAIVLCYRALGLADSPAQIGGYLPTKLLGVPRTRGLLFLCFFGYGLQSPLVIASYIFSSAVGGWRPLAMLAPQASLLMVAISTSSTACFMNSRYHAASRQTFSWKLILSAAGGSALLAGLKAAISLNSYVFSLSAIAICSSLVIRANVQKCTALPSDPLQSPVDIWSNRSF